MVPWISEKEYTLFILKFSDILHLFFTPRLLLCDWLNNISPSSACRTHIQVAQVNYWRKIKHKILRSKLKFYTYDSTLVITNCNKSYFMLLWVNNPTLLTNYNKSEPSSVWVDHFNFFFIIIKFELKFSISELTYVTPIVFKPGVLGSNWNCQSS